MRVLFVSDGTFRRPSSGSERVLYEQVRGLARQGYQICAITRSMADKYQRVSDVDGVREAHFGIPVRMGIHGLWRAFRIPISCYRQLNRKQRFDGVVCHQPLSYLSLLAGGCLKHIPRVYIFHSPWHQEYLLRCRNHANGRQNFASRVRQAVEHLCVMRSDKVVTLSQYMRDKLHAIHGVAPDKSVVIPGGVDLERFRPPADRLRVKEEIGYPAGALHLLTVRNLESRMGLDNLLESLRRLPPGKPAIHLTIVGDGPERENLRRLVTTNRLADRVTMTGCISASELVKHYGAADFFVLPTRTLEGFGLVTPESMACGTPVLGTPVGGTREILSAFAPEFLFADNSAEAIAAGIEKATSRYRPDGGAYLELRRRCREFVRARYSWDRHIRQLVSVVTGLQPRSAPSTALRGGS